ncbi:MAG: hypothetical protein H0X16_09800, partial [Chloroflexi bacterium]|nr:hypothetical protein [Chloroflexota bacterium]
MSTLRPRHPWRLPGPVDPTDFAMLAGASDLPDRVLRLLSSRAVAPGDLAAYHGDPADGLHDPRQLP